MDNSKDFYSMLTERLSQEWDSVDLYSISSCFGFYSRGMRVFAEVLRAMKKALTNPDPFRTKEMRMLLVADDNPLDMFGVERFHQYLERDGLKIRRLEKPQTPDHWIQFGIFRGQQDVQVLYTRPQDGFRDEALDLGVNRLAAAIEIDRSDKPNDVQRFTTIFSNSWDDSRQFDFPRIPSLRELAKRVEESFSVLVEPGMSERDIGDRLRYFLSGFCNPGAIHREYQVGSDRFDFVVGDPKIRLTAIELKLATRDEGKLKQLKGQVESYRKVVRDVLVILVGPIPPQKLRDLEQSLGGDPHVRVVNLR